MHGLGILSTRHWVHERYAQRATGSKNTSTLGYGPGQVIHVLERHAGDNNGSSTTSQRELRCAGPDNREGKGAVCGSLGQTRREFNANDLGTQTKELATDPPFAASNVDNRPRKWIRKDCAKLRPRALPEAVVVLRTCPRNPIAGVGVPSLAKRHLIRIEGDRPRLSAIMDRRECA